MGMAALNQERDALSRFNLEPHYSGVLVVNNTFLDDRKVTDLSTSSKASSDPTSSRSSSISSSGSFARPEFRPEFLGARSRELSSDRSSTAARSEHATSSASGHPDA